MGKKRVKLLFEEKYIAFIDVLGFTEIVNSENNSILEDYFNLIDEAFQILGRRELAPKKLAISDSLILIADDSDECFRVLLNTIQQLQALLAGFNIWVRGGIVFGPVFFDEKENIVVGKGFIQAFQLEKLAIYPRVIVDPKILTKHGKTLTEFCTKINISGKGEFKNRLIHEYGTGHKRFTDDDAIFVSYATRVISNAMKDDVHEGETALDYIYAHLRQRLYGVQQHYSKYNWVKKYFKEVLAEAYSIWDDSNIKKPMLKRFMISFSKL